jgi:hypothetical protein
MTMAREHARVLEMAFETFARQWGNQRMRQATSCQTSPARPHNTDTATPDRYHTAPV